MPWAANMAVDYIYDNCEDLGFGEGIELPDLNKARTAYKQESEEAAVCKYHVG